MTKLEIQDKVESLFESLHPGFNNQLRLYRTIIYEIEVVFNERECLRVALEDNKEQLERALQKLEENKKD